MAETFSGKNYNVTIANGTEIVNGIEIYPSQLILVQPQGTEVFDTFEELCEAHSICEEAREALGYAEYRVFEVASCQVLSLDEINTLEEAQKVADEIESEDREVVIQVRQGNEWVKVEG